MTVFAGHYGSVELKRVGDSHVLDLEIAKSDLYVSRKRFALGMANSLDLPFGTITTGDRIRISTQDTRGLPFRFYTNAANTQYIDNPGASVGPLEFFANVDTLGAIRMYRTFTDAIANSDVRYLAVPLAQTSVAPWQVKVNLLPGSFNRLGQVTGFTLSTERETVDTTALGGKYRDFASSAISGGGTLDCLFSFKNVVGEEIPLALSQLIQKIEVGSRFQSKLYILEPGNPQPRGYLATEGVFYEINGIFTKSAMTVQADQIAECSFDFLTAGEFKLRAGDNPVDLRTENNVSIGKESTLEELGVIEEAA